MMYLNVFVVSYVTLISSTSLSSGFAREVTVIVPLVSRTSPSDLKDSLKYFVSPFSNSTVSFGVETVVSLPSTFTEGSSYDRPLCSFFSQTVVTSYSPFTGAVNLTTFSASLPPLYSRWNG